MVLWLRFFARRPVVLSLRAGVRVACIRLVTGAVAGFSGAATLNVSSNVAGTNIIFSHRDASTRQIEVPVMAFSSILSGIDGAICLVKMDIEGSEFAVVHSTPPEAWARIPAIAMEIHEDLALDLRRDGILEQLASRGYRAQSDRMGSWFLTR
ncbi:MAG TPA: FkbM family methyltransferase [Vicinamibacterales bacterium]|jgi:FkbM family methyltransferase|nr:FkbM family methyltransferase [Vicinamibacterales bacterium]